MNKLHIEISVALCTYKRPKSLVRCLHSLLNQMTSHIYEVIVVDNDRDGSAESVVNSFRPEFSSKGIILNYYIEPIQNIAIARNRSVLMTNGDFVAFLDDDEVADIHWLDQLMGTIKKTSGDGVFGPVIPIFPSNFPNWMKTSNLFQRDIGITGQEMNRSGFRTSNVLVKKVALLLRVGPFNPDLGRTGGSDSELFDWLTERSKCLFYWCDEAIVSEVLEDQRQNFRWHLRRWYRHGWVFSKKRLYLSGIVVGILEILTSILLGTSKNIVETFCLLNNPRAAILFFLRSMSAQLGKIGFFLGIKIEEYIEK